MKNIEVTKFLDELEHPFRKEIELLRDYVLKASTAFKENIKWNGPNYSIDNKDRITMRVQPPKKQVQLIFHIGVSKKLQPKDRLLSTKSKMLVWKENNRAVATFNSIQDIKLGEAELVKIVTEWIDATK